MRLPLQGYRACDTSDSPGCMDLKTDYAGDSGSGIQDGVGVKSEDIRGGRGGTKVKYSLVKLLLWLVLSACMYELAFHH